MRHTNTFTYLLTYIGLLNPYSTKFAKEVSKVSAVTASIIQGSGLGPAAYLVTAADLRPIRAGNRIVKYADDTYLIVPEANSSISNDELSNIQTWATRNNLNLNYTKSKEITFVLASLADLLNNFLHHVRLRAWTN